MADASKTLSVAFGAFSCTLKGFDHPDSAVNKIEEYFHALETNSQKPGATPPVPDVDTLARITAQELGCEISAELIDNGIVLRPENPVPKMKSVLAMAGQVPGIPRQAHIDNSKFANENLTDKLSRIRGIASEDRPTGIPAATATVSTTPKGVPEPGHSSPPRDRPVFVLGRDTKIDPEEPVQAAQEPESHQQDSFEPESNTSSPETAPLSTPLERQPEQREVSPAQTGTPTQHNDQDVSKQAPPKPVMDVQTMQNVIHGLGQEPPESPAVSGDESSNAQTPGAAQTEAQSEVPEPVGETVLSPKEEASLAAILANINRGVQSTVRSDRASRALKDQGGAKDEEDIWRLLDEANMQMESTAGNHRRSVFSHLKAAVMSRFSDRASGRGKSESKPDETAPYRTDLANVVRTNTPIPDATEAATETQPDQPAPPVPDSDAAQHGTDSTAPEKDAPDPKPASISFAGFADKMGATGILSQMEAAAAYSTHILGQPQFSRDQVMDMVEKISASDNFSYDEGLHAFGQLLREEKIQIVQRSLFAIGSNSRYKP